MRLKESGGPLSKNKKKCKLNGMNQNEKWWKFNGTERVNKVIVSFFSFILHLILIRWNLME